MASQKYSDPLMELASKSRALNNELLNDEKKEPVKNHRSPETVKVFYNTASATYASTPAEYRSADKMREVWHGAINFKQEAGMNAKLDWMVSAFNKHKRAANDRPLRVGDVIELNKEAYAVGKNGFTQVPNFTPTPGKQPEKSQDFPVQEAAEEKAKPRPFKHNPPGFMSSSYPQPPGPSGNFSNHRPISQERSASEASRDSEPHAETVMGPEHSALERMARRLNLNSNGAAAAANATKDRDPDHDHER